MGFYHIPGLELFLSNLDLRVRCVLILLKNSIIFEVAEIWQD
jgi:hypothetical protein